MLSSINRIKDLYNKLFPQGLSINDAVQKVNQTAADVNNWMGTSQENVDWANRMKNLPDTTINPNEHLPEWGKLPLAQNEVIKLATGMPSNIIHSYGNTVGRLATPEGRMELTKSAFRVAQDPLNINNLNEPIVEDVLNATDALTMGVPGLTVKTVKGAEKQTVKEMYKKMFPEAAEKATEQVARTKQMYQKMFPEDAKKIIGEAENAGLSDTGKAFYRESTLDDALHTAGGYMDNPKYYSDNIDLALGQGVNKGGIIVKLKNPQYVLPDKMQGNFTIKRVDRDSVESILVPEKDFKGTYQTYKDGIHLKRLEALGFDTKNPITVKDAGTTREGVRYVELKKRVAQQPKGLSIDDAIRKK